MTKAAELACAKPGAVAGAPGTGAAERALPAMRVWFAFFVVWLCGWAAVALWAFEHSAETDGLALRMWVFALSCFYLSLCNSLLPLPTAWVVFLAAAPGFALVETAWLRVIVVAVMMGAATTMANLNEYHVLTYLLRFGLARRVRQTRLYGWAVHWFDRSPFQILLLVAFVPIPIDAVRWLAILRRYSRVRFAAAYFTGRGLRYVLFATCSTWLALGPRTIVAIQLGLVAIAILLRLVWRVVLRSARGRAANWAVADTALETAETEDPPRRAGSGPTP